MHVFSTAIENGNVRARFVLILLLAGCPFFSVRSATAAKDLEIKVVERPPAGSLASLYIGNRPPLVPSPLIKLPIGSHTPHGWLRHQLELEARGMIGHLEEVSKWCNFQSNAWADPQGQGHSGWEELPYWLKGYGDLGYVLKDERIIK